MDVEVNVTRSKLKKISDTEYSCFVEVAADVVQREFDNQYKKLQQTSSAKGFRKGKVPLALIKQLYRKEARDATTDFLVKKYLAKMIDAHKFSLTSAPSRVDIKQMSEDKSLIFEVRLHGYAKEDDESNQDGKDKNEEDNDQQSKEDESIRLEKGEFVMDLDISKENFNKNNVAIGVHHIIEKYREGFMKLVPIKDDRKQVQISDTIYVDCYDPKTKINEIENLIFDVVVADSSNILNNQAQQHTETPQVQLRPTPKTLELMDGAYLGNPYIFHQLEMNIADMQIGEKKIITVTWPKSHPSYDDDDKNIKFGVSLRQICKKILPPLDDQLAQKAGFSSLVDMQREAEKKSKELEQERIEHLLQKNIMAELIRQNPLYISPDAFEQQKQIILKHKKELAERDGKLFDFHTRRSIAEIFLIKSLAKKWGVFMPIAQEVRKRMSELEDESLLKRIKALNKSENALMSMMAFNMMRETVMEVLTSRASIKMVTPTQLDYYHSYKKFDLFKDEDEDMDAV